MLVLLPRLPLELSLGERLLAGFLERPVETFTAMDLLAVEDLRVWLDDIGGSDLTFPTDVLRRKCARLEWKILGRAAVVHLLICTRGMPASRKVFEQVTAVFARHTYPLPLPHTPRTTHP